MLLVEIIIQIDVRSSYLGDGIFSSEPGILLRFFAAGRLYADVDDEKLVFVLRSAEYLFANRVKLFSRLGLESFASESSGDLLVLCLRV